MPQFLQRSRQNVGSVVRPNAQRVNLPIDTVNENADTFVAPPKNRVAPAFVIQITTNSAWSSGDYALLFDENGGIADALSLSTSSTVTITGDTASHNVLKKKLASKEMFISYIKYKTDGTHKNLQYIYSNEAGGYSNDPYVAFMATSPNQYDSSQINLEFKRFISGDIALKVPTSKASETITLGFFTEAQVGKVV